MQQDIARYHVLLVPVSIQMIVSGENFAGIAQKIGKGDALAPDFSEMIERRLR